MASSAWPSNHKNGVIFFIWISFSLSYEILPSALSAGAAASSGVCRASFHPRRSQRGQQLCQAVVAHGYALGHGGFEDGVASFARFVENGEGERGFAALFDEDVGYERFAGVPGIVEFFGSDEAFGRGDFAANTARAHLGSVGTAPQKTISAANAQIDFADGHGPARRAEQPLFYQSGFGQGVKDEAARGIEDARHSNL